MAANIFKSFFISRTLELFNINSLDSYKVKNHNAFTLLIECKEVINDWQNANLKNYDNVKLCIEEVKSSITEDNWLQYDSCSKNILKVTLEDSIKQGEKDRHALKKLEYYIDKIIQQNTNTYLPSLFKEVDRFVSDSQECDEEIVSKLISFDKALSALATHWVFLGFSKNYIFSCVNKFNLSTFAQDYTLFKESICNKKSKHWNVIFKLKINKEAASIAEKMNLYDSVPNSIADSKIKQKFKDYFKDTEYTKYFIDEIESSNDHFSVANQVREIIAQKLDILHVNNNLIRIKIPNKAFVTYTKEDMSLAYYYPREFNIEGIYNSNPVFTDALMNMMNRNDVDESVKQRLKSALRHLRIGNEQSDVEQQFINYWIALEFIFASPEASASTFTRLKGNIENILASCYIKRNIVVLEKLLRKAKILQNEETVLDITARSNAEKKLLQANNILILYRFKLIKPLLDGHCDKRKNYLDRHINNLGQHISRMYRLRNKLIHEAAIKQDIDNITSHLRYYLVFVLNQMVDFFNSQRREGAHLTMDDMFYEYDMWVKRIKESYDLNVINSVPLNIDYLS